jgi:hypothetical protein
MPFVTPQFSRKQVNTAARNLVKLHTSWLHGGDLAESDYFSVLTEYAQALDIVDNWRSSHSGPLLNLRILLTKSRERVDSEALIAQRIKRLSSIAIGGGHGRQW